MPAAPGVMILGAGFRLSALPLRGWFANVAVAAVRRAWDAGLLAYRPGEMAGRDAGVTDWRQGTGGIGQRCLLLG